MTNSHGHNTQTLGCDFGYHSLPESDLLTPSPCDGMGGRWGPLNESQRVGRTVLFSYCWNRDSQALGVSIKGSLSPLRDPLTQSRSPLLASSLESPDASSCPTPGQHQKPPGPKRVGQHSLPCAVLPTSQSLGNASAASTVTAARGDRSASQHIWVTPICSAEASGGRTYANLSGPS
jgi:hypothetical protein